MNGPAPITPLPAPLTLPGSPVPALIVVGGSFDPPHLAHVELPVAAREAAGMTDAWLLYVPAAQSPHKSAAAASEADRLAMLRLAIDGVERAAVWTDELDRAAWEREEGETGPSYTVDTLARLAPIAPRATRLYLLMGADQAARLHTWRQPRDILRLASPLVLPRAPIDSPAALERALIESRSWSADEVRRIVSGMATGPALAVNPASSTFLREGLALGHASVRQSLDPAVVQYITARGLYARGHHGASQTTRE